MSTPFYTLSQLATVMGVSRSRLAYTVRKARIAPVAAVGNTYLYSREQANRIEAAAENLRPYVRREGVCCG